MKKLCPGYSRKGELSRMKETRRIHHVLTKKEKGKRWVESCQLTEVSIKEFTRDKVVRKTEGRRVEREERRKRREGVEKKV